MSTILTYHYVGDAPADAGSHKSLFVPKHEFESQLRAIKKMGLETVSPEEFHAGLLAKDLKRKVWLTFDDGRLDNYELAFPLLKEAGLKATFFIIADHSLGCEPGYITVPMMKEMLAAGMSIGSHTLTHPHLARIPAEQLAREVAASKQQLEDALGVAVTSFCYPYGNFNAAVQEEVRAAGYLLATATIRDNRNCDADRWQLRRAMVTPGKSRSRFRYMFSSLYHWLHEWKNRKRWKPREEA